MALASGDRRRAASVTEELERDALRSRTLTAQGLALRCRGLLDNAPEVLLEAVAAHRRGPRPFHLAAACEDAGVALGGAGRRAEAVSELEGAAAVYVQLDAVRDVERVQSALRTLGSRRARRAVRRPSFGWMSLTPTELRVVELVAAGLTNREIAERMFVSRRTVATRMGILRKLRHIAGGLA
jgi:DNA-binding CsgD family transcriptional regulator